MGRRAGRRPARSLRIAAALVVATSAGGVLVACTGEDDAPSALEVTWTERSLPEHPGLPGRTVVRDAVECGGTWYVVGAVALDDPTETRDTRPAAWASRDGGLSFGSVDVKTTTYWGKRAIINSIACAGDRVAAVGARSGGAHGNPRVTSFRLASDGRLVDVPALFTQYGGVSATNVGPISGGDAGWLIAGNRLSGPGVWVTDDPRAFTLVEGEPGLTDDGDLESLAQAGAWDGSRWVLVGAGAREGHQLDRDPLAWTSADGLAWQPEPLPAEPENEDVHRVVRLPEGDLLAVGIRGDTFAAWRRTEDGWQRSVRFGRQADDWVGAAYVASLVGTDAGVLATLSDGAAYQLWHSGDGRDWEQLAVPTAPVVAGDHTLVVGTGGRLLLLADEGDGGRVWTGEPG